MAKNVVIRDFSEIVVPKNSQLILNDNVFVGKSVEIGASNVVIDKRTSIQNNTIILGNVKIGKDCLLASNVYVSSGEHIFKKKPELLIHDQDKLYVNEKSKNFVIIEDDVWIGKNVVIGNNIVIGKGAIIGANSFVNKDVSPYMVVGGVPAKVISNRFDFKKNIPCRIDTSKKLYYPYLYSGIKYSLNIVEKYEHPIVEDLVFKFYLKNHEMKKHICLIVESMGVLEITFETSMIMINRGEEKIIFETKVNNEATLYNFKVNSLKNIVKIKEVFFQ